MPADFHIIQLRFAWMSPGPPHGSVWWTPKKALNLKSEWMYASEDWDEAQSRKGAWGRERSWDSCRACASVRKRHTSHCRVGYGRCNSGCNSAKTMCGPQLCAKAFRSGPVFQLSLCPALHVLTGRSARHLDWLIKTYLLALKHLVTPQSECRPERPMILEVWTSNTACVKLLYTKKSCMRP